MQNQTTMQMLHFTTDDQTLALPISTAQAYIDQTRITDMDIDAALQTVRETSTDEDMLNLINATLTAANVAAQRAGKEGVQALPLIQQIIIIAREAFASGYAMALEDTMRAQEDIARSLT